MKTEKNTELIFNPCKHCEYANLIKNECLFLSCSCYKYMQCQHVGCTHFKLGEWSENCFDKN